MHFYIPSVQNLEQVNEIQIFVYKNTPNPKFNLANTLPPWERLGAGCQCIDSILNGGFPINGISEVFGYSGTGKTQLGMQLALNVQLPCAIGGKNKGAVYICTEDVFPSKRYHQLAKSFRTSHNCSDIDFEGQTYLYHCADFELLKKTLSVQLPRLLKMKEIGLVVLDSIAGPFRSDYVEANYHNRGQHINEIAKALHHIAESYSIAVVCMNQVTQNQKEDTIEPCLGLAWGNNVTCRFYISRLGSDSTRVFETIFAPDLPNRKCYFTISSQGITADLTF
ncbi:unnamed protein product [Acanthoscelides obtectus]|uniref:RecA family profile 1 domain-containing protein n=1 Tax=Acanthoscelides obtectus TaxID=200917 RepID=A0A9P0KQT1_ACAOB|nr:unnamed protein product [Acanthoscelides obtectus]CAK1662919.1 DNA repair protein XRCC3 [Acanthoscelides obtectus]